MTSWLLGFASLLLTIMAVGLVRALRGPTPADRLLAVQLLGTAGIGVLLLLAKALALPALADVALVLALLAVVAVAALTRRAAPPRLSTSRASARAESVGTRR
jgi:multicomponent Na+:H+ antiporter subunit F